MGGKKNKTTKQNPLPKANTIERKINNKSPDRHSPTKLDPMEGKKKIQTNQEETGLAEIEPSSEIKTQQSANLQDQSEIAIPITEQNVSEVKAEQNLQIDDSSLGSKTIQSNEFTEQSQQQHLSRPQSIIDSKVLPEHEEVIQNKEQKEQQIEKERQNHPQTNIIRPEQKEQIPKQESSNIQERIETISNKDNTSSAFYSIQDLTHKSNIQSVSAEERTIQERIEKQVQLPHKEEELPPQEEELSNISQQPHLFENRQLRGEGEQINPIIQVQQLVQQLPKVQFQEELSQPKEIVLISSKPIEEAQEAHVQQLDQTEKITLTQSLGPSERQAWRQESSEIEQRTEEIHMTHPIQQFASVLHPTEERLFTLAYSQEMPPNKPNESEIIQKPEIQIVMKQSISFSDFNYSGSGERSNEHITEEHIKKTEEAGPVQEHKEADEEFPQIQTKIQEPQKTLPVENHPHIEHFEEVIEIVEPQISQIVPPGQNIQHGSNQPQSIESSPVEQQVLYKSSSPQISGVYISSEYQQAIQQNEAPKILTANLEQQKQQLKSEHEDKNEKQGEAVIDQKIIKNNSQLVNGEINSELNQQQPNSVINTGQPEKKVEQHLQFELNNSSQVSYKNEPENEAFIKDEIPEPKKQQSSQESEEKTSLPLKLIQSTILGAIAAGGLIWHKEYKFGYVAIGLAVFAGSFFLRK